MHDRCFSGITGLICLLHNLCFTYWSPDLLSLVLVLSCSCNTVCGRNLSLACCSRAQTLYGFSLQYCLVHNIIFLNKYSSSFNVDKCFLFCYHRVSRLYRDSADMHYMITQKISQNGKLISLYSNVLFMFKCFQDKQYTHWHKSTKPESCQMAKMFLFLLLQTS